jgi:hypothetical protein
MDPALALCLFALDRIRTILLALSVIIMVKVGWVLATQMII